MKKIETKYSQLQEEAKSKAKKVKESKLMSAIQADFSKILVVIALIFIALITLLISILTSMDKVTAIAQPVFYILCCLSVALSLSITIRSLLMRGR